MNSKAREPVSEVACGVVLIAALSASLLMDLLDDDPSRYLSYALLTFATPGAVAILYYAIRLGAHSWTWVVLATLAVVVTLADMFV
jgi:hypothetical protein